MDARAIGHEFVRQYYTLVHDDPEVLHRFYLDHSTFVHASEATPEDGVVGQKAIYERIKELNFVDCRARVRQVDSHQSVGGSIVVQVVGELSNNSEPMRPFVQTFVLVSQSPTKYYVHNDILRYQDHIVAVDSMEEGENLTMPPQPVQTSNGVQADQVVYYEQGVSPLTNGVSNVQSDGSDTGRSETLAENHQAVSAAEQRETAEEPEEATPAENGVTQEEDHTVQEPPKMFSWAERAGGKASGQPRSPPSEPAISSPPPPTAQNGARQGQRPAQRRAGSSKTSPPAQNNTRPQTNGPRPAGARTSRDIPDAQQVFVGNLPENAGNEEIRKVFRDYGTVLDVHMTTKRFCFVAFDSTEVVNTILQKARAARMNGEKPFELNGHRLNIEEKKPPSALPGTSSGRGRGAGVSVRGGRGTGRGGFRR